MHNWGIKLYLASYFQFLSLVFLKIIVIAFYSMVSVKICHLYTIFFLKNYNLDNILNSKLFSLNKIVLVTF